MCVSLTNATESEIDATKAVAKARGGYMLRMLAIAALLIIAIKSGYCDVIATIVPLLLMRPVLMLEEFLNYDKIAVITRDSSGKVTSVSANSVLINNFANDLDIAIGDRIENSDL